MKKKIGVVFQLKSMTSSKKEDNSSIKLDMWDPSINHNTRSKYNKIYTRKTDDHKQHISLSALACFLLQK